jgi:(S)-2-hydroxyglutarate dehydrogenase
LPEGRFECVVVGGGIVGLATAREVLRRGLARRIALLEKEPTLAFHQTGHNSGVIHSGVYYRPNSFKARLCREGRDRLIAMCEERRLPYRIDGKVIVARDEQELPVLEEIFRRGRENGIEGTARISEEEIWRHEPHVRGIGGIWVPTAGVVDYRAVAGSIADEIREAGGEILTNRPVTAIRRLSGTIRLETRGGSIDTDRVIACGGLQCDRLAGELAKASGVRIVPFRGDYYSLRGRSEQLIRALVYPVPDPRFPFLGVHFARHIHGDVSAGPNAVLAMAREGYGRFDLNLRDAWATITWPGFWRLARRHWRKGVAELARDYVKRAYWRELRRLVPDLAEDDLVRGKSGIRAQAVRDSGEMVEDFLIAEAEGVTHVLNAPSPAATSSLAIAREIVDRALDPRADRA